MIYFLLWLVSLVGWTQAQASQAPLTLSFLGDFNFPTDTEFQGTKLGGLSGLSYHSEEKLLYAISDDIGKVNPPRIYTFHVSFDEGKFVVEPKGLILLLSQHKEPYEKRMVDHEALCFAPWGEILTASEGFLYALPKIQPSLLVYNKNGQVMKEWDLPEKFLATHSPAGIQGTYFKTTENDGLSFSLESLSVSPSGKNLFVAAETALFQDDTSATFNKGALARFIQYERLENSYVPKKEFVYTVGAVSNLKNLQSSSEENGLSEILALNETDFLALERAFLPQTKENIIKVFYSSVKNATDVSKFFALKQKKFKPMAKTLVLNLDEIKERFNGPKTLDNMEGMAFGPRLPNGHQTLILVSDNNFRDSQRTLFLAFEIMPMGSSF